MNNLEWKIKHQLKIINELHDEYQIEYDKVHDDKIRRNIYQNLIITTEAQIDILNELLQN